MFGLPKTRGIHVENFAFYNRFENVYLYEIEVFVVHIKFVDMDVKAVFDWLPCSMKTLDNPDIEEHGRKEWEAEFLSNAKRRSENPPREEPTSRESREKYNMCPYIGSSDEQKWYGVYTAESNFRERLVQGHFWIKPIIHIKRWFVRGPNWI
jgi:hypothetical protein